MIAGHPLVRLAGLPVRPGFEARPCPDLPADPVRPLRVGAASLALFGIPDPIPPGSIPRYDSTVFVLRGATVISRAGIVVLASGEAVEDTLDHTDPDADGYSRAGGGTVVGADGQLRPEGGRLFVPEPRRHLTGRYLSLLLGNTSNHYHWLVLNLARLALLDGADTAQLDGTLIPAGLSAAQREWLGFTGLGRFVEVAPREAVSVENLVLPWNVASSHGASVRAMAFLRGWTAGGGPAARLFIDRRAAPARPLVNEDEVIDALRPHGFVPVALERMSAAEQVALFRGAEFVVGAHGAGLANIAFAPQGCRVVELIPSATVNWCYRHMAAAGRHCYDCVVGRSYAAEGLPAAFAPWVVSPTHVLSALEV